MTAPKAIRSKVRSIRADEDAWELLDWWASMLGVPLGSLLRDAMEDARNQIAAALANELDPTLPDSMLLHRVVRTHLRPPPAPRSPPTDPRSTDPPSTDTPSR